MYGIYPLVIGLKKPAEEEEVVEESEVGKIWEVGGVERIQPNNL